MEVLQGPRAKFRGMQEVAINTIIIDYSPIVIIAGIGTRKTIAIMLPASSVSRGTIIIIVLLYIL